MNEEPWRKLLSRITETSETPYDVARSLREDLGLNPVGTTFSETMGVKPVLGVIRTQDEQGKRKFCFKTFDPVSCGEWIGAPYMGWLEAEESLQSFTAEDLRTIHRDLALSTRRLFEGSPRRFVCLAAPEWADLSDADLNSLHGEELWEIDMINQATERFGVKRSVVREILQYMREEVLSDSHFVTDHHTTQKD